MVSFELIKQSEHSAARAGILHTPHGDIETPAFVPVATRASVRTLSSEQVRQTGAQLLIANTFHLHLTPGEEIVQNAGGIHRFMDWDRPLMTDSGGFQVFSMGFGSDHGVGKMLKEKPDETLSEGAQPNKVKITEDGVHFNSPKDGRKIFLGPKESIAIQEKIGADIIFAFDECPSPLVDEAYMRASMEKTHRWAQECIDAQKTDQALYGIVQGGGFQHLREESARTIGAMDFAGFGIGGEFGYDKEGLEKMVAQTVAQLPQEKPRHLLGVGHAEDFPYIVRGGADTFDCIAPTHYARHGTAFTSGGRVNLLKSECRTQHVPLDQHCSCEVCASYSRAYLAHLFRSGEISALSLVTFHNLYYLNTLAREMRQRILDGVL